MKTTFLLSTFFCTLCLLLGCKKEGIGGDSEITFYVKHHEVIIPNAMVYIKYNVNQSPGTDGSAYDDSTQADATARGHFHDLEKGNYYIYAVGYDSSFAEIVSGGIPVKIKSGEDFETVIPVVE